MPRFLANALTAPYSSALTRRLPSLGMDPSTEMGKLNIRRIRLSEPAAGKELSRLREQLSAQGNIVSAKGRALTQKVFGEALPPARVVERICADVRERGLAAVLHYTEQFDRVRLT